MNRTDRHAYILRRLAEGRPVTAQRLEHELKVSVRTVYRDLAALQAGHAAIIGEAGVGYTLDLHAVSELPPGEARVVEALRLLVAALPERARWRVLAGHDVPPTAPDAADSSTSHPEATS